MPYATYVLEVNWNGDGSTWVDETPRIIAVEWTRGRDYASQLTGRAIAGTLRATLQNVAGRFAPFYAAGPLFGNLVPGRKVRWRTTAPVAATLWQGFVDEIAPDPGARAVSPTAVLRAYGPLRWIADRKASTGISTSIATGTAVGIVLDDAGWPAGDRTIDTGQVTMSRWMADGDSALNALRELEETEFGFLSESRDGKIVFEDVFHRLVSPHTSPVASFSDADGAALPYDALTEVDPWKEVFNRFAADVFTFTTQSIAVLWTITGEAPAIGAGQSVEFWASYPNPDSPTNADSVETWTTPVASTDYTVNTQAGGGGADITAAVTVAVSKFAKSMKITLTNTGAVGGFITLLQARGTAVWKNDPIRVVAEDSTSQTKYGKRSYTLPGKFYPTTVRARSFVQYGLSRYKDPLPILAMTFRADATSGHLSEAINRDVSERITVRGDATTASGAQLGINEDFFIEAMTHRYILGEHWVTYLLSSTRGDAGYWAIGISTLGVTTKLAP